MQAGADPTAVNLKNLKPDLVATTDAVAALIEDAANGAELAPPEFLRMTEKFEQVQPRAPRVHIPRPPRLKVTSFFLVHFAWLTL